MRGINANAKCVACGDDFISEGPGDIYCRPCFEILQRDIEIEKLKAENEELEARTGWRYDEPNKYNTYDIIGMFLHMGEDCRPYGLEAQAVEWYDDKWQTFGGYQKFSDCRLLCWKPIDWDV